MIYLKEHRNAKSVTMSALAESTGLSKRTLEDIQRRGDCLVSNAEKIAAALGITLNDLCTLPETK